VREEEEGVPAKYAKGRETEELFFRALSRISRAADF
jgi:hypothetical protein